MPMFTTVSTRLPVTPVQDPSRTAVANAAILSSTSCTSWSTSCPSTVSGRGGHEAGAVLRAAQRGVQHRAVLGDVDVLAGDHRRRSGPGTSTVAATSSRCAEDLLRHEVLREVDGEVGRLEGVALGAARVVGEPAAEVGGEAVGDRVERLPGVGVRRVDGGCGHGARTFHREVGREPPGTGRGRGRCAARNASARACAGPHRRRRCRAGGGIRGPDSVRGRSLGSGRRQRRREEAGRHDRGHRDRWHEGGLRGGRRVRAGPAAAHAAVPHDRPGRDDRADHRLPRRGGRGRAGRGRRRRVLRPRRRRAGQPAVRLDHHDPEAGLGGRRPARPRRPRPACPPRS